MGVVHSVLPCFTDGPETPSDFPVDPLSLSRSLVRISKFSTADLPPLQDLVPDDQLPSIIFVHDPHSASGGSPDPDHGWTIPYRRIPREQLQLPDIPRHVPRTQTETETDPRTAHLYLHPKNRVDKGRSTSVLLAPLSEYHTRIGARTTVVAKLMDPVAPADALARLENEARMYGLFPLDLMDDSMGLASAERPRPTSSEPTPALESDTEIGDPPDADAVAPTSADETESWSNTASAAATPSSGSPLTSVGAAETWDGVANSGSVSVCSGFSSGPQSGVDSETQLSGARDVASAIAPQSTGSDSGSADSLSSLLKEKLDGVTDEVRSVASSGSSGTLTSTDSEATLVDSRSGTPSFSASDDSEEEEQVCIHLAIVPKFFGYYVPMINSDEDAASDAQPPKDRLVAPRRYDEPRGESGKSGRVPSPILLMEACGTPLSEAASLTEQSQTTQQLSELYARLHDAGFMHGAPSVRNVIVQPGPLDVPADQRSLTSPSFRITDFARGCTAQDVRVPFDLSEEEVREIFGKRCAREAKIVENLGAVEEAGRMEKQPSPGKEDQSDVAESSRKAVAIDEVLLSDGWVEK